MKYSSITLLLLSIALIIILRTEKLPFALMNKSKYEKIRAEWVNIKDVPENLVVSIIISEDKGFRSHLGFDFLEIGKSLISWTGGKKLRGASTITQQTAKNLFLWNERSILRKLLESYFTVLLEISWSKSRIMETYLNIIEFNKEVYGVRAASQYYYHKKLTEMTEEEIVSLAAIIPNPQKMEMKDTCKLFAANKTRIYKLKKMFAKALFWRQSDL